MEYFIKKDWLIRQTYKNIDGEHTTGPGFSDPDARWHLEGKFSEWVSLKKYCLGIATTPFHLVLASFATPQRVMTSGKCLRRIYTLQIKKNQQNTYHICYHFYLQIIPDISFPDPFGYYSWQIPLIFHSNK